MPPKVLVLARTKKEIMRRVVLLCKVLAGAPGWRVTAAGSAVLRPPRSGQAFGWRIFEAFVTKKKEHQTL